MHPRRTPGAIRSISCVFHVLMFVAIVGCDTMPLAPTDSAALSPNSSRQMPPVQSPVYEAGAANDEFAAALAATLPLEGSIVIEGAIDTNGDIDFYMLGAAAAGDQIVVDVTGHNGLNLNAGLFDGGGDLIDANNDRSYYAGQVDPYIVQVIRESSGNLYLGISVSTASHFASASGSPVGSYSIRVTRKINQTVRLARRQVVWLDFEGGDLVQIAQQPVEMMRPFTAESISSQLGGQTNYIVDRVVAHMRQDLAGYDVVLVDSKHSVEPIEYHTTLYFGNFNSAFLGLADNVDTGNAMMVQKAIIYTEDLHLWESLQPTADEVAQAIANIGAHELGHLLGLEHTAEQADLMATASSARQVLEVNSSYQRSRLERSVFPVGWQNNPHALSMNVGGANNTSRSIWDDLMSGTPNNKAYRDEHGIDVEIHMCDHTN